LRYRCHPDQRINESNDKDVIDPSTDFEIKLETSDSNLYFYLKKIYPELMLLGEMGKGTYAKVYKAVFIPSIKEDTTKKDKNIKENDNKEKKENKSCIDNNNIFKVCLILNSSSPLSLHYNKYLEEKKNLPFAIKVMTDRKSFNDELCAFESHNQYFHQLHPRSTNIVKMLHHNKDKDCYDLCSFLLEYYEMDLQKYLDINFKNENVGLLLSYLFQMLNGLNNIHKLGYFHGDIKPSNMLINRLGDLVLSDFNNGGNRSPHDRVTTLWYVSPEVLLIKNDRQTMDIMQSNDIWGIGVSLLCCIFKDNDFPFIGYSDKLMCITIFAALGTPTQDEITEMQWDRYDRLIPDRKINTNNIGNLKDKLEKKLKDDPLGKILIDILLNHILIIDRKKRTNLSVLLNNKAFDNVRSFLGH
jgi:serine/threonine protein kinase